MPVALTVTLVEGDDRIAVRCPVCNAPVVSGAPAGRFRVRCRRRACRAVLEITGTVDMTSGLCAPYSSGPRLAQPEESGPCQA